MKKYEVWITRWSDEVGHQIKEVAGEFNSCMNANLFAQAYADYYSSTCEIVEYVKKGSIRGNTKPINGSNGSSG